MKVIDELCGPPICLIFHFYHVLTKPFEKYKIVADDINSIVLIKLFGMGSILLATPMMRALKARFPKAKIIFLTFSGNKQICQRIPLIDEIIPIESDTFLRFLVSLTKAICKIRSKRCQISIDLEFFAKSSTLIQYLLGTKVRVGYYLIQIGILLKMMWRGDLLTHQIYYNQHKHTIQAFLALARSLGADTTDLRLTGIKVFAEDNQRIESLFMPHGIGSSHFLIAMNINASQLCLERRWPIHNFVYLTEKLQVQSKIKLILIGDTNDKDYVKSFISVLKSTDNIIDLTGQLDIGGLAALLSKTNLLITCDSGPMHLADSLSVPIVAFFGPETPIRFKPLGNNHTIFYPDVYCSPCLNVYNQKTAPCSGNNLCMNLIPPEEVYTAIKTKYLHDM